MKVLLSRLSVSGLLLTAALACSSNAQPDAGGFPVAIGKQAINTYKKNVFAEYGACLDAATKFDLAVDQFTGSPTEATHRAVKDAWIAARVVYGPSEAHRLYNGPIDNDKTGPEPQMNGWPLDESFIDYTREVATSGLVNDTSKAISPAFLAEQNEKGGDTAITTGWHALEFLLWGQDDAKPGTGAGKRPYTDFVDGGTAKNQDRRRAYLEAAAHLLIEDLGAVKDAWDPAKPDSFAGKFGIASQNPESEKDATKDAIGSLLKALGSMSKAELSGERMTVAFKNRSEEDEHSCFSDTTATDILGNGIGVQNVWLGRYGSNDGVGLDEVVKAVNPALAEKTTKDLADAITQLQALKVLQDQGTPVDVILLAADGSPGRVAMLAAVKSLKLVGDDVEEAIKALGLKIELTKPTQDL
jgi:putative iron-regulated protein